DVDHSAVQYVRNQLGLQVSTIANLADLLTYLGSRGGEGEMEQHHKSVLAYRQRYGVND
ncbi:MAG: orotate phosphoribosyltransferase, partial [Comamonas sp.]